MDLSEESRYRLAFLTMRLVFDAKLSSAVDPAKFPGVLRFLDVIAGTNLANEAAGKKYPSQRDKLEMFLESEYEEDMLELVKKVVSELV